MQCRAKEKKKPIEKPAKLRRRNEIKKLFINALPPRRDRFPNDFSFGQPASRAVRKILPAYVHYAIF